MHNSNAVKECAPSIQDCSVPPWSRAILSLLYKEELRAGCQTENTHFATNSDRLEAHMVNSYSPRCSTTTANRRARYDVDRRAHYGADGMEAKMKIKHTNRNYVNTRICELLQEGDRKLFPRHLKSKDSNKPFTTKSQPIIHH